MDNKQSYELIKLKGDKNYYYYYNGTSLDKLLELSDQRGFTLIDGEIVGFRHIKSRLEEQGVLYIDIVEQLLVDSVEGAKEWDKAYYKKWLSEDRGVPYRVFLTENPLPVHYFLKQGDKAENEDLGSRDKGKVEIYEESGLKDVYIDRSAFNIPELKILEEYIDKVFKNITEKNHFARLLSLALMNHFKKSVSDDEVDKVLKEYGYKKKDLEEVLKDYQELKKVPEERKVELNKELNELEKTALRAFVDQLEDLTQLEGIQRHLDTILNNIEALDEEDAHPNSVVGYLGEKLVEYWLNEFGRGEFEVERVADKTREYDLALSTPNGIFEIDVKTTIKPVSRNNEAVAFYIKASQYRYIRKHRKENYYIARVSLTDLGLTQWSDAFSELNNDAKEKLNEVASNYIANDNNRLKI